MSITDSLNDRQKEAVLTTEGPLLVLAGAGSGKTRALTHRIAYLIEEKKVRPWNILAITFTNKAAGEMRERVNQLVSSGAEEVWVSTFHSMCVRILRRFADRLGYDSSFTIYDSDDQKSLMRQIIKQKDLDPKRYREKGVLAEISSAKNELITPEQYSAQNAGDFYLSQVSELYAEYAKQCRKNNAMDFDDLIMKTVELLAEHRDVKEYYQDRFRYILVDEYQDTNTAQFRLVEHLAGKYKNLCVVGDDDQSIYKFRGANIYNILNFEKAYPGARVIRLEQNYRSTKNILNCANAVIANNEGRKQKTLWTENESGTKVKYRQYDTAGMEAEAILRDIEKAVEEGESRKQCAILYRTNAQSRILEEKCVAWNIPYRLVGGVNFYQRLEIKDILSYLKTIDNAVDDLAVQRIINVPKRGIGQTSINKLSVFAANSDMSFYEACRHAEYISGLGKAAGKIASFTAQIEQFRRKAEEESLEDLIDDILKETGYREELEAEDTPESRSRLENLEELVSKAVDYEKNASEASLGDFLEQVALVADIDTVDPDADRILLMTLHSAKGLEFDRVYLSGMEEGIFPSYMSVSGGDEEELEEERRLCYVGITRARKNLMLTSAKSRMINGETRYSAPSRFVKEIPDELLDQISSGPRPYDIWKSREDRTSHWSDPDEEEKGNYSSFRSGKGSSQEGISFFEEEDSRAAGFGRNISSLYGASQSKRTGAHGQQESAWNRSSSYGRNENIFDFEKKKQPAKSLNEIYSLGKNLPAASREELGYEVGDRVKHVKFGIGTVQEIQKQKTDFQVTVEFEEAGVKKMYAAFAKLVKVEE